MTSKTFNPDFYKVDLVALYATMYLKRIVVEKLPWKQHLFSLYEEVKEKYEKIGKRKRNNLSSQAYENMHECTMIKTLRVLEFSTGVSDKVICHALWNIDKKSNKVLQAAIKDKKEGRNFLALPHLEVLRSNIQMSKNAFGSMRVTLGAAALVIQPKLRIVENRFYWSTLQAIQVLLEYEERYKVKHERRLAVDRLLIPSVEWPEKNLYSNLPLILEIKLSSVKELCVDATDFTIDDFWPFISELGSNLKHLTLRVTFSLVVNFYVKKKSDDSLVVASRNVETLSIIFSGSEEKTPFDPEVEAKAMTSFLVCFPELKTIRYYNLYHIPPLFAGLIRLIILTVMNF
ncbi:hypothetical protein Avbf_14519 [Armadillidium vulgare]|nr:hypothetical protein Avbf_14519 [Armadillidium vulgare]